MPWELTISLGGSLTLAAAVLRSLFAARRIPRALTKVVRRDSYLKGILAISKRPDVDTLDVLAPQLRRRDSTPIIGSIQEAWRQIATRGRVRVLTVDTESCLGGGVQLMESNVEVRITRSLDSDSFSYHLFGGRQPVTVVNGRSGKEGRASQLAGHVSADIFQVHFNTRWSSSRPIESVLAEHAVEAAGPGASVAEVGRRLRELNAVYNLDDKSFRRVVTHAAFQHGCKVVFIVGLPGAGKSFVRRRLADQLRNQRIQVAEMTDYPPAYRDFIRGLIRLEESHDSGFSPHGSGAFEVRSEEDLVPALRELADKVLLSTNVHEVTLVEFARANIETALRQFSGDVLRSAQVVYVRAPSKLRDVRLSRRSHPPTIDYQGNEIRILVSDDHALPDTAKRTLYQLDNISRMSKNSEWQGVISRIDNNVNDQGGDRVDSALRTIINNTVEPYVASSANEQR